MTSPAPLRYRGIAAGGGPDYVLIGNGSTI